MKFETPKFGDIVFFDSLLTTCTIVCDAIWYIILLNVIYSDHLNTLSLDLKFEVPEYETKNCRTDRNWFSEIYIISVHVYMCGQGSGLGTIIRNKLHKKVSF